MGIMTSKAFINILAVIDADYIVNHYEPNKNSKVDPQLIDNTSERLICAGSRGIISGQGTSDLSFKAVSGDFISFRGLSTSNNSDDAVIIYNIHREKGDLVFKNFVPDMTTVSQAVIPDPQMPNGLPALYEPISFASFDSKIRKRGTESLSIQFGVYMLESNGQKQSLYGYYEWNTKITVD
ncbi:Inclusion body protein [Chitinophaga sp. CF118]|uniref:inclusion body family protein n=1 Tax=Chitinophaga sp. CF118 TaxID=1884367 RepID=UPI0008F235E1|nr:inclusion body family protein [Chitinophaga sp. CF118]SFD88556.1 Inclusion body protein [Chitinophaga sp. CF118]